MNECTRGYDEKKKALEKYGVGDCSMIILYDLMKHSVPDDEIMSLILDYFVPLAKKADMLKQKYGKEKTNL